MLDAVLDFILGRYRGRYRIVKVQSDPIRYVVEKKECEYAGFGDVTEYWSEWAVFNTLEDAKSYADARMGQQAAKRKVVVR